LAQDDANVAQKPVHGGREWQAKLAQADQGVGAGPGKLVRREMLSQEELDAAVANRDTLAAQLKVAQSNVDQARAVAAPVEGEPGLHHDPFAG